MAMMPEDISPRDWLSREVYAWFGLAMYSSQVLEHGIINLVEWSGLRDGRYRAYEETEAANAELFRQTLGAVKKILLSRRPDIGHLDDLLIRAVRLRNFLAHEYFRQRAAACLTEDGKNQMIEELKKAVAFFENVDAQLEPLTMQLIEASGVGKHMPDAMEAARNAGFGDPLPGLLRR
jgi:hypothetical protein